MVILGWLIMDYRKDIGNRIKEVCDYFYKKECTNLTKQGSVAYMAKKIRVLKQSMYNYTSSNSFPRSDILIKFQKLGISIDWILTGIGEMFLETKRIPFYNLSVVLSADNYEKIEIPIGKINKHNISNISEFSSGFYIKASL